MRISLFVILLAFSGMAKGQNTFWDNWFLQAGVDMSLMNPYGCNFSQVFPRGKTFGVNVVAHNWPRFIANTAASVAVGYIGKTALKGMISEERPDHCHNWPRFIVNTGASVIVAYGVKSVLKKAIKEERPDGSDKESFPSGHATMAFAAARSIDKEFRSESIWIPIAGYAAATAIGVERVASDRHHWYDVVAGAALGYGASELTWWLSDKIFPQNKNVAVTFTGNSLEARIFLDKK